MTTNLQAFKLCKFLESPAANDLMLNLPGSVAVAKNSVALKPLSEALIAAETRFKTPSESYLAFEKLLNDLILECAARDDNGKPIVDPQGVRLSDPAIYQARLLELSASHKEAIDEYQDKIAQWEKYIAEEADVKIIKILEKDVSFSSMKKSDTDAFLVMLDLESKVEAPL